MITEDEERRYGLKPVPDIPFCGPEEAKRRREAYEASRRGWNAPHERGTRPSE